MAQNPGLDLKQFAGCNTGLAAFVGRNLEKLLVCSLAHQALMENTEFLGTKLKSSSKPAKENLKKVIEFVHSVQRGKAYYEALLSYTPLTPSIHLSLQSDRTDAEELVGEQLFEAVINLQEPKRKKLLRKIVEYHISEICKPMIGDLTSAFIKESKLTQQIKDFLSCKTRTENEDKEDAKVVELEYLIREGVDLCLQRDDLQHDAVKHFKKIKKDTRQSVNPVKPSESILRAIELLKISVTQPYLKQDRWQAIYNGLLKQCRTRHSDYANFINALKSPQQTQGNTVPGDVANVTVLGDVVNVTVVRNIANRLKQDCQYQNVRQYYKAIASSQDDEELVDKIKPVANSTEGLLIMNARHELLCNIMLSKWVFQIGNSNIDWVSF